MKVDFGYGTMTRTVDIPDKNLMDVLRLNVVASELTGEAEVWRALREPIGSRRLGEIVSSGEKIVIVTSDIIRPMPTATVMTPLLEELFSAGVDPADVTLVFALGSYRKHTYAEKAHLAGVKAFAEIDCIDGDIDDFIHLGDAARGTPVDIVRCVAEADRRICLGNIEYHHFAGYSGGAKAIMPGVSTRVAIALVLEKAYIFLISELPSDFVKRIFLTPFGSVQDALKAAFQRLGDKASVLAIPYGGSTLPFVVR